MVLTIKRINLNSIFQIERESFEVNQEGFNFSFPKYSSDFGKITRLTKDEMIRANQFSKIRMDNPIRFDSMRENYDLEKLDNHQAHRFPEPNYFTTNTKYFEYDLCESNVAIDSSHASYQIALAFQIRQLPYKMIPEFLDEHEMDFQKEFKTFLFELIQLYSYLFPYEQVQAIECWKEGVTLEKAGLDIHLEERENGSGEIFRPIKRKLDERLIDFFFKEILNDEETIEPDVENEQETIEFDVENEEETIEPDVEIFYETKKVSFEIEMRDVFLTEMEQARNKEYVYKKGQRKLAEQMIDIVKEEIIHQDIFLQEKETHPEYFLRNQNDYCKKRRIYKKDKRFPEPDFFVFDDDIFSYFGDDLKFLRMDEGKIFRLFFAFRLRQIPLEDISDFLKFNFEKDGNDFMKTLELILVEYKCLLPKLTRKLVRKWKKRKGDDLNFCKNNSEVDFYELEIVAMPLNYYQIEGKLKKQEVLKFCSFLFKENEGCTDGKSYLSKAETMLLLKYGLTFPKKEPKEKRFTLNLNTKRTKANVFRAFYELFSKMKPYEAKRDYKNDFAKFLKYNFTNFPASEKSIRESMRRYQSSRTKMNIEDYLS